MRNSRSVQQQKEIWTFDSCPWIFLLPQFAGPRGKGCPFSLPFLSQRTSISPPFLALHSVKGEEEGAFGGP